MEKLLKQVDKAPSLKDAGGGLTNMIPSNPLTDGMGSMITGQLMSPPTVYYVAAFAILILTIIGCLIYLFVKVRSVDKSVKTLVQNPAQQFQQPVQQQPQVIGYDQATGQPIMSQPQVAQVASAPVSNQPQIQQPVNQGFQSGMFWPNGTQMTQRDIEKEQKPLRKRGIIHLFKTLIMVIGDPDSLNKIRTGAYNPVLNRVQPQFQQPVYNNQQFQQPVQQVPQQFQQIAQQIQQPMQQQFQQMQPVVNQQAPINYGDPRLPNNVNPQSNVIPMPTSAQR